MKISIFGTGYVGLVTGVCFAEMGNSVICADIDPKRIAQLKDGISPIYEPGLDALIKENVEGQRLQFSTDVKAAVRQSDFLFIAVGTPSSPDGSADLKYVYAVAENIGLEMEKYKVIVNKSTVPMGTQKKVKNIIAKALDKRGLSLKFDVVSNPEFLREGSAIEDCLKPSRVVVGCDSDTAADFMKRLYDPFLKSGSPLLIMDPLSSEMSKYAANAMLATKISLMNEFSRICDQVGADIESVRRGIGTDFRIGPHFIFAGVGYGGSCFPKDIKSLIHIGSENGEECKILKSVEESNQFQRQMFLGKLKKSCGGSFEGKKICLWGAAFKPGTDDIREAPSLFMIQKLTEQGAKVSVFDPVAENHVREYFGNHEGISFFKDQYEALNGVDALLVVTEWKSFRNPDFERMKSLMKRPVICDGRNIYRLKDLQEAGFNYISVGRPSVINS